MLRWLRGVLIGYREAVIAGAAGAGIVGYVYLTPPAAGPQAYQWLPPVAALDGDLPQYVWRYLVSAVFLGFLPASVCAALGERAAGIGLAAPRRVFPWWVWVLAAIGCLIIAAGGAYSPSLSAFYPQSKTLEVRIASGGLGPFALHAALYLLLFYLPWELLFRGILVFPMVRLAPSAPRASLLAIASLQAIPSALVHLGHPAAESFGAVAFGIGAGALALESGSILPGLAIHAGIGIVQDLLIVLRHLGTLP
jgi:hypothetical protein